MPTIARMRARNITCRKCRHRHPAFRSCEEAARLAAEAASRRAAAREPAPPNAWETLAALVEEYGDARETQIEADVERTRSSLRAYMLNMQRELSDEQQ